MADRPPPLPIQPLPYAARRQVNQSMAWRNGPLLITTRATDLPSRCVKCNADCQGYWLKQKFHSRDTVPAAVFGAMFSETTILNIGMCPVHRKRRTRLMVLAWCVGSLGAAAGIAATILIRGWSTEDMGLGLIPIAILLLIAGLVVGTAAARTVLVLHSMSDQFAWFKGACPEFLALLPTPQ